MTQRPPAASAVREAGPVRLALTAAPLGTHWTAIGFTLLVAVAVIAAATNTRTIEAYLLPSAAPRASATARPSPTLAPTAPPASALASAWVDQSRTPVITVGGSTRIMFKFRNAGSASWRRDSPSEARLGVVGAYDPRLARDWLFPERPTRQSESVVLPGETATFAFDVIGPAPGRYRLHVRPVVDGVAWLTDQGAYIDIEVRER